MHSITDSEELTALHLVSPVRDEDHAANGAPAGEPEVWAPDVVEANPHLAHVPEPEPVEVSPAFASDVNFDIASYLEEERGKDLLRFSTAGSVDDGKSTLIGRLLYDTQSVYADQVRSIEGKGTTAPGVLDLALLTDGLRAEREQGITIDVAYRYFSTARRKFIIADTPGHEQYTRNMATGASTADVAIVLIDARKGVLPQSRRHAYITALLGVRHVIVAINKMDLVDYDGAVFHRIEEDFRRFFQALDVEGAAAQLHFVPVSALAGDNVVHGSEAMSWYSGPSLLGLLESLPAAELEASAPFRMSVQRVVRPNLDFRGFAGQIEGGTVRVGDPLTVLPSGQTSRVVRIPTFDGDLAEAAAPLSITLVFEDEIDISRGDLLVTADRPATVATSFTASLVWMDATPLEPSRRYLLKHGSRIVPSTVRAVLSIANLSDVAAPASQPAVQTLNLNEIGTVTVETLQPLAFDTYAANRHTGSFVLIDLQTNATVAAGMIRSAAQPASADSASAETRLSTISREARAARYGHAAASIHVASAETARALERALFDLGAFAVLVQSPPAPVVAELLHAGVIVIAHDPHTVPDSFSLTRDSAEQGAPSAGETSMATSSLSPHSDEAVAQILQALRSGGVLRTGEYA